MCPVYGSHIKNDEIGADVMPLIVGIVDVFGESFDPANPLLVGTDADGNPVELLVFPNGDIGLSNVPEPGDPFFADSFFDVFFDIELFDPDGNSLGGESFDSHLQLIFNDGFEPVADPQIPGGVPDPVLFDDSLQPNDDGNFWSAFGDTSDQFPGLDPTTGVSPSPSDTIFFPGTFDSFDDLYDFVAPQGGFYFIDVQSE